MLELAELSVMDSDSKKTSDGCCPLCNGECCGPNCCCPAGCCKK